MPIIPPVPDELWLPRKANIYTFDIFKPPSIAIVYKLIQQPNGEIYRFNGPFNDFAKHLGDVIALTGFEVHRAKTDLTFTRVQVNFPTGVVPFTLSTLSINGVNILSVPLLIDVNSVYLDCELIEASYFMPENSLVDMDNTASEVNCLVKFFP